MDSRNDYGFGPSSIMDDVSYRDSSSFGWNMFLFAVAVAMIAVNWGFLRPASRQLDQMRVQIRTLEKTVEQLTAKHGSAEHATSLLTKLVEQSQRCDRAADGLARME